MELTREEIAQDRFLTTTNKDYFEKHIKRRKPKYPFQYKDPIAEGHILYLKLDPAEDKLEEPFEAADKYLQKVREKYKKTSEKYFTEPLNHGAVIDGKLLERNTTYKIEYCNIVEKLRRRIGDKEKKLLPDDYRLPETTLRRDFRNPSDYDKTCFSKPTRVIIPPNCISHNEKINEILKVKTGSTEYEDTINKFGEIVIRKKIFGKMNRPKV